MHVVYEPCGCQRTTVSFKSYIHVQLHVDTMLFRAIDANKSGEAECIMHMHSAPVDVVLYITLHCTACMWPHSKFVTSHGTPC